jgi:hypothetical protein
MDAFVVSVWVVVWITVSVEIAFWVVVGEEVMAGVWFSGGY